MAQVQETILNPNVKLAANVVRTWHRRFAGGFIGSERISCPSPEDYCDTHWENSTHTLRKLQTQTNYAAIRTPDCPSGWKVLITIAIVFIKNTVSRSGHVTWHRPWEFALQAEAFPISISYAEHLIKSIMYSDFEEIEWKL